MPMAAPFDPASLALTGWWRAAYAGAPWAGTASAGASGSRNLTGGIGVDPTVGATLNGLAGADFAAGPDILTTGLAGSSFFGASALSGWALVRADTVIADPGAGSRWTGNAIWGDSGATYLQLTMTAAGASLYLTNSGFGDEVTAACGTGAPHLIQYKFDGTDLKIRVDSGSWQTQAASAGPGSTIDDLTNNIRFGYQTNAFDGRMWDLGLINSVLSDATFDNIKSYVNTRYALAL